MGLVSGVDRSPALRLLWVLSALSVPAAPPSCAHRHVARLTSRRPCCSLQQVSTAQLPLNPARLQGVRRHALPPAQLTSAQLTCFRLSSAHLSSAHLPLGAPSWPASLGLTSRVEPPATPSTLPPAGMVGQGRRTSRCSTSRKNREIEKNSEQSRENREIANGTRLLAHRSRSLRSRSLAHRAKYRCAGTTVL